MAPRFVIAEALLFLIALAVVGTFCSPNPKSGRRTLYFGWYGDDPVNQTGWVNTGVSTNITEIQLGLSFGIKNQFLRINHGPYFEHCVRGGGAASCLRPDWREILLCNVSLFSELLSNGTIVGFFLGDELMWNGILFDDFVEWSNGFRSYFPTAFMWENEGAGIFLCNSKNDVNECGWEWGCRCFDKENRLVHAPYFPPALNAISFDLYLWLPRTLVDFVAVVRKLYEDFMVPRLWPNQSLFLVPGSAGSNYNPLCSFECYEDLCSRDALEYYHWALNDTRITGMIPWSWGNEGPKGNDEIGTINMPRTKAIWQKIGREIVGSL